MSTAGDVYNLVAAFMDDPERDVATDSYLQPFVQQCHYRLYENIYSNPNIQGAKQIVVLVGVPGGTTSLKSYINNELKALTNIFDMREKPSGQSDNNYRQMMPSQDIAIPLSQDEQLFNGIYVVIQDDIILPGASQSLDIRVYGEFRPIPITSSDTPILQFSETILAHWVCELIGVTRGATPQWLAYHRGEKEQAIAELFNSLIMNIQEIPTQQRPFNTSGSFDSF